MYGNVDTLWLKKVAVDHFKDKSIEYIQKHYYAFKRHRALLGPDRRSPILHGGYDDYSFHEYQYSSSLSPPMMLASTSDSSPFHVSSSSSTIGGGTTTAAYATTNDRRSPILHGGYDDNSFHEYQYSSSLSPPMMLASTSDSSPFLVSSSSSTIGGGTTTAAYATTNDRRSPEPEAGSGGGERKVYHWTREEHRLFLIGLEGYGRGDWRSISRNVVKTKSATQVASHAQKYFKRQKERASMCNDNNMVVREERRRKRRSSIHDITDVHQDTRCPDLISQPAPAAIPVVVSPPAPVDDQYTGPVFLSPTPVNDQYTDPVAFLPDPVGQYTPPPPTMIKLSNENNCMNVRRGVNSIGFR